MMENAGRNLAHLARRRYFDDDARNRQILVLARGGERRRRPGLRAPAAQLGYVLGWRELRARLDQPLHSIEVEAGLGNNLLYPRF